MNAVHITAGAIIVCLALCLTTGVFSAYLSITSGSGWWLTAMFLVPPLVALAGIYRLRPR